MTVLRTVARGALAGALATALMTPVQLLGMRPRSRWDRVRWMPRRVFARAAARAGLARRSDTDEKTALAAGAHFAYGTTFGILYALWRGRRGGSLASGIAFGLALWAASYAGYLPALRLVPPPDREDPAQTERLIAAHVVYGAVLGLAVGREP